MSKNTTQKQLWKSGDWRNTPNDKIPYNGIEISCLSTYNDNEKLLSLEVCFSDYTFSLEGVSSTISNLPTDDKWTEIPKPLLPLPNEKKVNPNFSIKGNVKIQKVTDGSYLRIHLSYGPNDYRREELGFIFKV